ncbi:histone-fold domain-containing protein [Rhodotorula paludigena]|uniref:histone-fold domain-containing protein n=1 Tax=Rhodotorula paludigena TaxID=86838 RepID=UPI00316BC301
MSSAIPSARVNRIIKADKEVRLCSKEAIFLISKATEMMIERMSEQAYDHARMQKKNAKVVKYDDLAAVAQSPQWYYLGEVIPQGQPLHAALEARRKHNEETDAPAAVTTKAPNADELKGNRIRTNKGKKSAPLLGVDGLATSRTTRGVKLKLPAGEGGPDEDDEDEYEDDGEGAESGGEAGGRMDVDR